MTQDVSTSVRAFHTGLYELRRHWGWYLALGIALIILAAVVMRFPSWGWTVVNGLITLLLGMLMWADWPVSGLWVIGLFVGIEMIFSGWSWVMLALAARRLAA
jgi:uncharacterized membrane protein HdeD (DUF308 family)